MIQKPLPIGRLAPSPTGPLHLGNAFAFLMAWLLVRQQGGRLIFRLEDLDPLRSKSRWAESFYNDLHWLGLDWDEGPDQGGRRGPYVQSERFLRYEEALEKLRALSLVYPCHCTRKELRQMAGAPHIGDEGAPYPGLCRNLSPVELAEKEGRGQGSAWRLNLDLAARRLGFAGEDDLEISFNDSRKGLQIFRAKDFGGDFPLKRSDGVWSYQMAVSVDDGEMGVSQVVRGEDLLSSTPRQIILLKLLGHRLPDYIHLPLLLDSQGERLAKRHQSLSLASLRERGFSGAEIVGALSRRAGLNPDDKAQKPHELLGRLDIAKLPEHIIIGDGFPEGLKRRGC